MAGRPRIGVCRKRLPIRVGTPMGGYAARTGSAVAIQDQLEVAVLTVSYSGSTVVFVVLDLVAVDRSFADRLREEVSTGVGVDPAHVLVSATHTHSGPDVHPKARGLWERKALETSVTAVWDAITSEVEADLVATETIVDRLCMDRRGTPAIVQGRWPTLVAVVDDAQVLATFVVAACHPVVYGPENRSLSADYVGQLREVADRVTGGTTVVAQGCAAQINPATVTNGWSEVVRVGGQMGAAVGAAALGAVVAGKPIGSDHPTLGRYVRPGLATGRRVAPAAPVGVCREVILSASRPDPVANGDVPSAALESFRWVRELIKDGRFPVPIDAGSMLVQTIRIGRDYMIAALPGEPFGETSLELRSKFPELQAVIGYANGYTGYLPPRAEFSKTGYEVGASTIGGSGEERLRSEITKALIDIGKVKDRE